MARNSIQRRVARQLYQLGVGSKLLSLYKIGRPGGYLDSMGWFESARTFRSINKLGEPLPWITYPAIHFLEGRISPNLTVFEYGSGASTLWWAKRVSHVTAVEHDESWVSELSPMLPSNARVIYESLPPDGNYLEAISKTSEKYDVVVIDGVMRNECVLKSIDSLTPKGVIVWDNSERERYGKGINFLVERGFRRLPFEGLAPIEFFRSETSIFYRQTSNCLEI